MLGGTSIRELQQRSSLSQGDGFNDMYEMQQNGYGNMQDLQFEQGHNSQHVIHQNQHIPYRQYPYSGYREPLPDELDNRSQPMPVRQPQATPRVARQPHGPPMPHQVMPQGPSPNEMEELARDISDNLPEEEMLLSPELEQELEEEEKSENGSYLSIVPRDLREPLIIVALFIILSQPQVRNTIARYIKQINPGPNGQVPMTGILAYGVIFATLFHLVKTQLL